MTRAASYGCDERCAGRATNAPCPIHSPFFWRMGGKPQIPIGILFLGTHRSKGSRKRSISLPKRVRIFSAGLMQSTNLQHKRRAPAAADALLFVVVGRRSGGA